MAYKHCNRRGDVYLLQAGKTQTGKPRYLVEQYAEHLGEESFYELF